MNIPLTREESGKRYAKERIYLALQQALDWKVSEMKNIRIEYQDDKIPVEKIATVRFAVGLANSNIRITAVICIYFDVQAGWRWTYIQMFSGAVIVCETYPSEVEEIPSQITTYVEQFWKTYGTSTKSSS
jgi:hypothetical protein